jgi:hypothetical protein
LLLLLSLLPPPLSPAAVATLVDDLVRRKVSFSERAKPECEQLMACCWFDENKSNTNLSTLVVTGLTTEIKR